MEFENLSEPDRKDILLKVFTAFLTENDDLLDEALDGLDHDYTEMDGWWSMTHHIDNFVIHQGNEGATIRVYGGATLFSFKF